MLEDPWQAVHRAPMFLSNRKIRNHPLFSDVAHVLSFWFPSSIHFHQNVNEVVGMRITGDILLCA